jgi:hypothetical protein
MLWNDTTYLTDLFDEHTCHGLQEPQVKNPRWLSNEKARLKHTYTVRLRNAVIHDLPLPGTRWEQGEDEMPF